MGVNLSSINLDGIDPNTVLDAIPAGWYDAVIVGCEMKPTKDNATTGGQYMEVVTQITTGEHAGRKLYDNLNLVNANPTAVEIAFKTLKSIYNAIGVARVNDSSEMHGKPLKVKVKLKAKTTEYDARNEVQGYDGPNSVHTPAGVTAGGIAGAPVGQPAWATGAGGPGVPSGNAAPAWAGAPAGNAPGAAFGSPGAGSPAPGNAGPPAFTPPGQAAPAAVHPMQTATNDGWQAHPQYPGYYWKGQETLSEHDLTIRYTPAQPAAPAGPPAFTPGAPAGAPVFAGAGAPTQPWQQPTAGPGAPAGGAPAFGGAPGGPAVASGAPGGPVPAWAQ